MTEMKTTGNKLLVEIIPEDLEIKSESGIHLGTQKETKSTVNAKVISIGKDVKEVSVGDTVVYEAMAGQEFSVKFENYCIVPEPSILGYRSNITKVGVINE